MFFRLKIFQRVHNFDSVFKKQSSSVSSLELYLSSIVKIEMNLNKLCSPVKLNILLVSWSHTEASSFTKSSLIVEKHYFRHSHALIFILLQCVGSVREYKVVKSLSLTCRFSIMNSLLLCITSIYFSLSNIIIFYGVIFSLFGVLKKFIAGWMDCTLQSNSFLAYPKLLFCI